MRQPQAIDPMTLDPQLTIIRTREAGADFYDAVMRRVKAQPDQPSGVMFHFTGTFNDEFFAVTAYRDPADSESMFSDFTSPEVANVISETGRGPNISRDEYEITRYAVNDVEELEGFRITRPGEFVAVLITQEGITRERYITTTQLARFPEEWPVGMVIHVAGVFGTEWGVFDVWRADADMAAFYGGKIAPALAELRPGVSKILEPVPAALELHSLYVDDSAFKGAYEYLREE
jgi:hypothetical protein